MHALLFNWNLLLRETHSAAVPPYVVSSLRRGSAQRVRLPVTRIDPHFNYLLSIYTSSALDLRISGYAMYAHVCYDVIIM
jgi:hypothetical protein